jgi:hypothetical protein
MLLACEDDHVCIRQPAPGPQSSGRVPLRAPAVAPGRPSVATAYGGAGPQPAGALHRTSQAQHVPPHVPALARMRGGLELTLE